MVVNGVDLNLTLRWWNMKINNIIMGVLGVVICAIVISGAFLPAVASALVTSGDPISYYNDGGQAYRPAEQGDIIVGSREIVDDVNVDTWTLNGEVIKSFAEQGAQWTSLIFSDGAYGRIYNSSNTSLAGLYDISQNSQIPYYLTGITMEFTANTIEISATSGSTVNTFSWAYTWAYIPCPSNDGVLIANAGPTNAYVLKDTFLVVGGLYSTGEIARFYYSNNSPMLTIVGEGSGTIEKTYNRVDGTTDIYNLNVNISVTDGISTEDFGPYQILVPYKVDGHKDSGPIYAMYSVLPIIAIVGLVMAGIYIFISRK